jgi:RimJ/RimL family protein N-acetyltransferase
MIYVNNTKTLRIRPFNPKKDITEDYLQWFEDPDVTKHNSHGLFRMAQQDAKDYMGNKDQVVWAIEVRDDKEYPIEILNNETLNINPNKRWAHVGNAALQSINFINRSAELAIIIGDKGVWGRGIGEWACQKLLYHAFYIMGLNRVWTGTAETNEGMRTVARKIGMRYEGAFKDGMWLNGRFIDVLVYGIVTEYLRGFVISKQELMLEGQKTMVKVDEDNG